MKRASIIAMVPVAVLFAVWTIPGWAAEETPKDKDKTAAPATADAVAESPELNDAWARFRERDFDGALRLLKKAVEKNPELSPAQVIIARFFARANMPGYVRNSLERAVIENANDPEAYAIMGDIALSDRRIVEARLLYEKADSLMAKFNIAKRKKALQPQVLAGLGMTAQIRGDWAGAQQQIETWLKLDPKSTAAMRQLAQCMLQQKNVQGALEELAKASKIDPDLPSPEATVAEFYARTNDRKEAQKWMIAALTAKPKDIGTRVLAARWAFETGQIDQAKTQADAALQLIAEAKKKTPTSAQLDVQLLDSLNLRGLVALFEKKFEVAEDYFQRALLLRPNGFAASNNLALALIEQNNEEQKQRALEYAEANAAKYGKTNQAGEAYSTYGWVLYKIGKYDDAEKYLRGAISGGPFSPDTAYYMARVLSKRGRDKDAKQLLESALKSEGPFANRDDAKSLLAELKK